jgi:ABC-2 type transport system ATP-binding protein
MEFLLDARAVSFGRGIHRRVNAVDLQLHAGERLALLGVNGAGKSTLMQLLSGILAPTEGEVRIKGQRLERAGPAVRRQIGFLPQRSPLYPELSVFENLLWAGQLRGLRGIELDEAIDSVLDKVDLAPVTSRLAGNLSAGMAQRLAIAQAVVHEPDILILDEPTAGLDPLQTENIRRLLRRLSERSSLVLATHLLDDVQQLCERVIVLHAGHKTAEQAVLPDTDLLAHFRAPGITTGITP